jgi:LysM repeat protein
MAPKKLTLVLIAALMLALPACTRSASTPPPGTGTPGTGTPGAGTVQPTTNATEDPLAILAQGATQTAMVAAGTVLPTPTLPGGTPVATQGGAVLPTATLGTGGLPAATPVGTPAPTYPIPTLVKPATYTLQPGEFPYCIARRFNVNPDELLSMNGLSGGTLFQPGMTLNIPQTSLTFPGERALIPHPASYVVVSGDTVYSIACKYGDVDPLAIAAANGLQPPYTITVGQTLQIP